MFESIPLSNFPKTKEGRFPKRYVDSRFYNPENYQITSVGKEYLNPIVDNQFINNENNHIKEYYGIY